MLYRPVTKQINITFYNENGEKRIFNDVSSIIFDGRDALIKTRERCHVDYLRLFENALICVEDRDVDLKEYLPDRSLSSLKAMNELYGQCNTHAEPLEGKHEN